MDLTSFENALRADGFAEIETRHLDANIVNPPHSHPFDVRALVSDGEITLTVDGTATRYETGQIFTMASGCQHAEAIGPAGVTYVVGRRADGS